MAVNAAGNYTKPTMRAALFRRIKASGKGGRPGQWSARKAQMIAKQYKPSLKTGERYLPESAIKSLSSSEYAATTRKKRAAMRKGKQVSKQPKKIAKKTASHRKFS